MSNPTKPCIYCLKDVFVSTKEYHVLPFAIGNTKPLRDPLPVLLLPQNVVCDSCNQYFGSKVEPYLINHPYVEIRRVLEGIYSRKGRPIYKTETLNLARSKSRLLDIRGNADQLEITSHGVIKIKNVPIDKVTHKGVSRALHKIAFEQLYLETVKECDNDIEKARDFILLKKYDHLRKYIRKPGPADYRPYGMARGGGRWANIGKLSFKPSSDQRIISASCVGYSITLPGVRFVVAIEQNPNLLQYVFKELEKRGLSPWVGANEAFWDVTGRTIITSS